MSEDKTGQSTVIMPSELINYEPGLSSGLDGENYYAPLDSGISNFHVSDDQTIQKQHEHQHELKRKQDQDHSSVSPDPASDLLSAHQLQQSRSIDHLSSKRHHGIDDEHDTVLEENENPAEVYLYDHPHVGNEPQKTIPNDGKSTNAENELEIDENSLKQVSNAKASLEAAQFFEAPTTLDLQRSTQNEEAAKTPADTVEQPFYVNAKQYYRILKRRYARAKLEENLKISRERRPYLHESRHKHAMRRPRGQGGRFLTTAEMAEMKRKEEAGDAENSKEDEQPRLNVLPQQLPGPIKEIPPTKDP